MQFCLGEPCSYWPIGSGKEFKGVYDRASKKVEIFSDTKKGTTQGEVKKVDINDPEISWLITDDQKLQLEEEIELQDGAGAEFDQELVSKGELSPVFFGSALTNFGVETFLQHFLQMTTSPLPRISDRGPIDPMEEGDFSAFVFKIIAIGFCDDILMSSNKPSFFCSKMASTS